MRADGHPIDLRVDIPDGAATDDPAATSDPSWSPDMPREWPKFIMGASRTWLGPIASAATAQSVDLSLYERYRAVDEVVDELWFKEGIHAFFHHLNALFGYQPLRVNRCDIMISLTCRDGSSRNRRTVRPRGPAREEPG